MYTFRYNPVFKQWVLLGSVVPSQVVIKESHILDIGRQKELVAATYPRNPFVLDPENNKKESQDLLYADHPPVGEYELILYKGALPFWNWEEDQWYSWLELVQHRLLGFHHNPHLHYVSLRLHTAGLDSVEGYERVGDLIATSHPVDGQPPLLTAELAEKICTKESIYILAETSYGRLYVPTAPLHEQEIWYIPKGAESGIESLEKAERHSVAHQLAKIMKALHEEYGSADYTILLHTALASHNDDATWWLQIYRQTSDFSSVAVRALPEALVYKLKHIF